jgi:hypothetical protein
VSGYLSCCCRDEPSPCTCVDAGEPFASVSSFFGKSQKRWLSSVSCTSCGDYPRQTADNISSSEYAENRLRLECDGYADFSTPNAADDRSFDVFASSVSSVINADLLRRRCSLCDENDPNPNNNHLWIESLLRQGQTTYDYATAVANGWEFPGGVAKHRAAAGVSVPADVYAQWLARYGEPLAFEPDHFYRIFELTVQGRVEGTATFYGRQERCSGIDEYNQTNNTTLLPAAVLVQINDLGPSCDVLGEGSMVVSYVSDPTLPEPEDAFGNRYGLLPYDKTVVTESNASCPDYPCYPPECAPVENPPGSTSVLTEQWEINAGVIGWTVEP